MRNVILAALCGALLFAGGGSLELKGQTPPLTMRGAMSRNEYASSGIATLTEKQQYVIDRWLNRWTRNAFSVSCGGSYPGAGENQSIETNAEGKILILDDGSIWLVESVDQVDSTLWLAAENVIVVEARRPMAGFQYTVINTDENEKVLAKYLGQE